MRRARQRLGHRPRRRLGLQPGRRASRRCRDPRECREHSLGWLRMEVDVRVRVHRPLPLPDQGGRPTRSLHEVTTTAEQIDLEAAGIRRSTLNTAEAFSGARLELLAFPDGRRLVAKHLPAAGDWLTRATGGRDRPRRLWETGVLDRVDAVSDHTVVAVQTVDDHTV